MGKEWKASVPQAATVSMAASYPCSPRTSISLCWAHLCRHFFCTVPSRFYDPSLTTAVTEMWDCWLFLPPLQLKHGSEWKVGEMAAPEIRCVEGGHQDHRTRRYLFHVEWRTAGRIERWSLSLDCAPHIGICTPQSRNCYLKITCMHFNVRCGILLRS